MKRIKKGGRQKGTPNRITSELRGKIKDFLFDNWQTIESDFKNLEPEKRILLFEKLLKYVLPQQIESEVKTTDKTKPLKIEFIGRK